MKVEQIYSLMNTITGEILGKTDIVAEDLSNVIDIGTQIFDATSVDNYVKTLVNQVGKMIFVNRPYKGFAPKIYMDGWEYGSVLEKISATDLPEAKENEAWDLTDGTTYNQDVFYKPKVSVKFFNKRVTFDIDCSIAQKQVKESFQSPAQLNGFIELIFSSIEKSLTVKLDSLVMRTINNLTAQTIHNEYPDAQYSNKSGVRAVNLLKLYNEQFGATLTIANAITNPDFIKFAVYTMTNYIDRMRGMSTLFNIGGKNRFTPPEFLKCVMLSEFKNAANAYLQSDTFHEQYTALPSADTVPYWQGSGTGFDFASTSAIHINTDDGSGATNEVVASGILAVLFDRDACGITNPERSVDTHYNGKAQFTNYFYHYIAEYFNDLNENFVVFFIA